MSTLQELNYTIGADVTINVAGLPDGSKSLSDVIDNSITRYIQADIGFKFKTNQHGIDNNATVIIGILRSCDGGVTYDSNLRPGNILAIIDNLAKDTNYTLSVATNVLGYLPAFFKISIRNSTGAPFFHEASHFGVWFTGKKVLEVASSASFGMAMGSEWLR